ncbi:MAG: hypothetical protein WCI87_09970, partial [Euryarchaeota archaeon]
MSTSTKALSLLLGALMILSLFSLFATVHVTANPGAGTPIRMNASNNVDVATQVPSVQWEKSFTLGSWTDDFNSIKQTTDGGYIAAGRATFLNASSHTPFHNMTDGWLVKFDANGNKQWQLTRGIAEVDDRFYSVQQTTDGGYIAAGSSHSYSTFYDNDAWLVKTDASGKVVWEKTFGTKAVGYEEEAHAVQQTSDGGFILAGVANGDAWLIKTDQNGNGQWSKT